MQKKVKGNKGKWLTVLAIFLALAFAGTSFAANPLKIIVNGEEIKTDVSPQIINGRTMVPVRSVVEALGANVDWDEQNKEVSINDSKNIWNDPVSVTDPKIRDAISVVSRYFAYLIGYSPEDLTDLATSNALDTNSPTKIWQPFMFGVEHEAVAFEILDGRKVGEKVEIATRLYITNSDNTSNSSGYEDTIYTVVFVPKAISEQTTIEIPLIDGCRNIASGNKTVW